MITESAEGKTDITKMDSTVKKKVLIGIKYQQYVKLSEACVDQDITQTWG